jgi:hypothetical protein
VSARLLAGIGAWVLGAAAATGGCLLAVSALGQGLAPGLSQTLSMTAVNHALAGKVRDARPAARMPPVISSATPMPPAEKSAPTPSVPIPHSAMREFNSPGGSVKAICRLAGAYLVSLSPAQGYRAISESPGPAATAKVTFAGSHKLVTMAISCRRGVPSKKITHADQ